MLLCAAGSASAAVPVGSPPIMTALDAGLSGRARFPPPGAVFHLAAAPGAHRIELSWTIRPGFYLYRSRFRVKPLAGTVIGTLELPRGIVKIDPYLGREQIYRNAVTADLPVMRGTAAAPRNASVAVTYQGCADAGLCYPPITHTLLVALHAGPAGKRLRPVPHAMKVMRGGSTSRPAITSSQGRFAGLIRSGNLLAMLGAFYLAGLALAFTPCCLPMIPILSGLIAGGRKLSAARSLLLSSAYVMGMALTYTLAGIAAAAAGGEVQAAFQRPWILGIFTAVLAAMGLAMLGVFSLQMPAGLQTRLAALANRRTAGTVGGVAAMGALSALIVTTCVAPALVGALAVIGQSGAIVRGGAALFALSIGMGTPLLAVGASAGRLLPSAGPWMDLVKKLLGALLLAVAVWMLSRLTPARVTLALWAAPALAAAWTLSFEARRLRASRWPARIAGALSGAYALVLITSAALGGTNPLAPLSLTDSAAALRFTPIHSVAEMQSIVRHAAARHQSVMVDFYATWCTSCREMEATTFTNPAVRQALAHTVLLRADVTSNNAADQALLRHFGIFGPPTVVFYNRSGHQVRGAQVVGYMKVAAFLRRVRAAFDERPPA